MKLTPSNPNDIAALLKDAEYGYQRDDTDGYNFARECVKLANALANPKPYFIAERSGPGTAYKVQTHSSTGSVYTVCECYYAREAERLRDLLNAAEEKT